MRYLQLRSEEIKTLDQSLMSPLLPAAVTLKKQFMKNLMKAATLAAILFVAVSLSSCKKPTVAEENTRSYSHTWHEIVNKGNIQLFDTDFAPHVTYDNVTTHLEGNEEVKKYFSEYITGFSNRDFKVLEIYGKGDRVIKRWSFTGTHTGNFAGIKATGKRITVEGVTIAVMKYGKIVAERDYADDLGFLQKLGAIPAL